MTLQEMVCNAPLRRPCALPMQPRVVVVCRCDALSHIPDVLLRRAKTIYALGTDAETPASIQRPDYEVPVVCAADVQHPMLDTIVYFHHEFSYPVTATVHQVVSQHFHTENFFLYMPLRYNDGIAAPHVPNYFVDHKDDLEYVFDRLADDESRQVFAGRIRALETGDMGYLKVSAYPEYFHPLVRPQAGDVLLDGGVSAVCDSQIEFIETLGPSGRYFGFEPDPAGLKKAMETLGKHFSPERFRLVPMGLWQRRDTLYFFIAGVGTRAVSGPGPGVAECPVVSIDEFYRANRLKTVDFIKLDVEGAELATLLGAAQTIADHGPRLAISLYHTFEDLYTLPRLIDSMPLRYTFYMGHHYSDCHETVLYCLPQ